MLVLLGRQARGWMVCRQGGAEDHYSDFSCVAANVRRPRDGDATWLGFSATRSLWQENGSGKRKTTIHRAINIGSCGTWISVEKRGQKGTNWRYKVSSAASIVPIVLGFSSSSDGARHTSSGHGSLPRNSSAAHGMVHIPLLSAAGEEAIKMLTPALHAYDLIRSGSSSLSCTACSTLITFTC
jgi:hypothetical protein